MPITYTNRQEQKKRKIILNFLAGTPPKDGQTENPLSEPIGKHSLKVSTKAVEEGSIIKETKEQMRLYFVLQKEY